MTAAIQAPAPDSDQVLGISSGAFITPALAKAADGLKALGETYRARIAELEAGRAADDQRAIDLEWSGYRAGTFIVTCGECGGQKPDHRAACDTEARVAEARSRQ